MPILIIITILSLLPFSEIIAKYIIKYRKYISKILYFLCFASFLFLIWEPDIDDTWEYALELLWILLWLPILAKVFNLVLAKKIMMFRKEIWILMWVMALVHSLQYFMQDYNFWFWEKLFWVNPFWEITYLAWWFVALVITIILTITSNNYSIKNMWKYWKILHRTVYILLIFTLLHVALLEVWEDWMYAYVEAFTPFVVYFGFKIVEWKGIVLLKDWKIDNLIYLIINKNE